MIELNNISIYKPGWRNREPILLNATASFGERERVGILASPGSGKTSIARVLGGIEKPDCGEVIARSRVSWPIGFAGFLHPELTIEHNLSVFARLMGMEPASVIEFCADFCEFDVLRFRVMKDLTPTQRALLGYACALSVPGPATWIADEVITVGEPREREKCDEILTERLEQGGLIFLSRNARQLKAYCDRFLVLIDQHLVECENLEIAQTALELSAISQPFAQMRSSNV